MRNEGVLVDSGELNSLGDTLVYLSNTINKVASNVDIVNENVQEQINDMKNNVSSLEEEVRSFISEIKQSTLVGNAKQSIMISQMEYDKKYGHRDDVRRRVIGLLQAVDINVIKKNTMENIGEETVVNNPDYWLAPALVALCYWFSDNKEMATAALKKAIDRSDEKTSFFFCLVHLRANRTNTAIKWLNRYLALQDPTKMDCKIILLLDALSSGVFDTEIKDLLLKKIDDWKLQLNTYDGFKQMQISRWENYFKSKDDNVRDIDNYINDLVREKDFVNDTLHYSNFHVHMMEEFKKLMNEDVYTGYNHFDKIDKLLHMLIFDYDDEELNLKSEIQKNKNIINLNGKIDSDNEIDLNSLLYYEENDLYTHISNISLNDSMYGVNLNTKKMAISFSKDFIIQAYRNITNPKANIDLIDLNIVIDDWIGITKDGSNEIMLLDSLEKHIEGKYSNVIDTKSLFSTNMLISVAVGFVGIILVRKYLWLIILIFVILIAYNSIMFYKNYKDRSNMINQMNDEKNMKKTLLLNVICEIVDYYFIYFDSKKKNDEFIKYIQSLNYNDYIITSKQKKKRNIIMGGK